MKNVLERLLNLLAFLLTAGRAVTADEIRQTVAGYHQDTDEAFRRMFERDKDLLRRMGVPLDLVPPAGERTEAAYRIDPASYAVADPGLTEEERAALWFASQVVRIGGAPAGGESLLKLGGVVAEQAFEPLSADLGAQTEVLADLYEGVSTGRQVRFGYGGRTRTVAPHGLGHRRGHWYLVAVTDDGTRVFRVDRMVDVEVTDRPFERDPGVSVAAELESQPWEAGTDEVVRSTVKVDASLAWWAERRLGRSAATRRTEPDGSLVVTLDVSNPEAFVGWVLGFGPSAEILEPAELRSLMVDRIRGTA